MDNALASEFLEFSRHKLRDEYWPRLRSCAESLTDEQLWWRANDASNSIGNLLLHLNGNVRQWLITSFEDQPDQRDRPAEFAARDALPTDELLDMVEATLNHAAAVLGRLGPVELQRPMNIQGFPVTGLQAVYHVVEHFGMHYGQIVYITKLLQGEALDFYRELDATGHNP